MPVKGLLKLPCTPPPRNSLLGICHHHQNTQFLPQSWEFDERRLKRDRPSREAFGEKSRLASYIAARTAVIFLRFGDTKTPDCVLQADHIEK
jgi:hypothetical protein